MKFRDLKIGMKESLSKVFHESDVKNFAELVMDKNPVHLSENYAAKTIFKSRIVHGILVSGLISAVIGMKLPGEGSIYLGQDLKFLKPVFIGDEIVAIVEITNLRNDKKIVTLKTICINQKGESVIEGEAIVKLYE
ncbi:MaoC family dehydratase [Calditrichota bacterium GD2]